MSIRIERVPLHQMQPGQLGDFFAILCERVRKTTRDGKPYYALKFRDRHRCVSVPIWDNSPQFLACDQEWEIGRHFKIRAIYQEHERYGPQIEIHNIRFAGPEDSNDGYDPDDFELCTRFNADELFEELADGARQIADLPLRDLVMTLLNEHEEELKVHPAASRNHHAFKGGLIEHTVSVLRTGIYFAEKYAEYYPDLDPPLNKDLIIAGCILHDIGKLRELDRGLDGGVYTVSGVLIGHILQGRDMIREAARKVDGLNPELLLYLEHIITSHQGLPEWGSPTVPMMPEALLVHFADDVDAKMNIFVGILQQTEGDGPFTDQGNILRRRLLKDRNV